jgi:hypothetical protein
MGYASGRAAKPHGSSNEGGSFPERPHAPVPNHTQATYAHITRR